MSKKSLALSLLAAITLLAACKRGGDDGPKGAAYLQCPADSTHIRASYRFGTMVFPSAFSPNGDGRNDILRLVSNDPRVVRFMRLRISDDQGTTIKTLYSLTDNWNGYNTATNSNYPAGNYRVDYNITLHGGTGTDSVFEGHTCVRLYSSGTANCLNRQADSTKDLFEDQLNTTTMATATATKETFCP